MQKGLISFIIPIYRNFEGVYDTLKSVFLQDYPQIEIILSDDGSPNYEREIPRLREYAESHRTDAIQRIVYHHLPENQGTVRNANEAYHLAEGEYIKDLSPEDILVGSDALTKYVRFLENSGQLICFCRQEGITESGKVVKHLASSAEDYETLRQMSPVELQERLFARNCLPGPAWFAKKELFERYGYYLPVTRLIEDYPYWLHLCKEQVPIGFMDDVLIRYRLSNSGKGHYSAAFLRDMYAIQKQCIFPYDKRYGIFQPVYNWLKTMGLDAYMDRTMWDTYTSGQKGKAWLKHGIFFLYMRFTDALVARKNQKEKQVSVSEEERKEP
ncbi:MAG: glycosyltransferase [Clostridia bacterium]|nr:glycosyltransferase [Clostridia bacterium]